MRREGGRARRGATNVVRATDHVLSAYRPRHGQSAFVGVGQEVNRRTVLTKNSPPDGTMFMVMSTTAEPCCPVATSDSA